MPSVCTSSRTSYYALCAASFARSIGLPALGVKGTTTSHAVYVQCDLKGLSHLPVTIRQDKWFHSFFFLQPQQLRSCRECKQRGERQNFVLLQTERLIENKKWSAMNERQLNSLCFLPFACACVAAPGKNWCLMEMAIRGTLFAAMFDCFANSN